MKIHSNIRDYPVYFAETLDFLVRFDKFPERCFVIDSNVWRLYGDSLRRNMSTSEIIVLPINEEMKSLDTVAEIYNRLIESSAKRNMTMISVGGGILQDVSGFAASTLYRGINWVFVPTTLLAQADSCIGSKTSLNYRGFKNLVGTFYPPSEVFIHVPFLSTLEEVDFLSGLGEVVKLHIMGGKEKATGLIDLLPKVLKRDPESLFNAVKKS
ncbi:MAG TPA: 3-dehydroquinate synthase family protein, partial [Thermodesulfovibrionales bacterium]|nr:3-dehydroquinate synthase family protein [Thermodesulfovibrionales bacterium]